MPGADIFHKNKSWKNYLRTLLLASKLIAIAVLIFALARPRTHELSQRTYGDEGIDIVLAMDISGSMKAEDFKPNRMEASKDVAMEFVKSRPTDRIGIVVVTGFIFQSLAKI